MLSRCTGGWGRYDAPMQRLISLVCLFLLVACAQAPSIAPLQPATFNHPLALDVASVRVLDNTNPSFRPPYVEHQLSPTLPQEVQRWADETVQTVGSSQTLEIRLSTATITEKALPENSPYELQYDAKLEAEALLFGGERVMSDASVAVSLNQQHFLPKNTTYEERLRFMNSITSDLMEAFDTEMRAQMQRYFAAHIR